MRAAGSLAVQFRHKGSIRVGARNARSHPSLVRRMITTVPLCGLELGWPGSSLRWELCPLAHGLGQRPRWEANVQTLPLSVISRATFCSRDHDRGKQGWSRFLKGFRSLRPSWSTANFVCPIDDIRYIFCSVPRCLPKDASNAVAAPGRTWYPSPAFGTGTCGERVSTAASVLVFLLH